MPRLSRRFVLVLPFALPAVLSVMLLNWVDTAAAQADVLSAEESDPKRLGWMQGFPPVSERVIGQPDSNYFSFPKMRWTVCHFRELLPTKQVSRGLGAPTPLTYALDDAINNVMFTPLDGGEPMSWQASLNENYTDGLLILHQGQVVYEYYAGCLDEAGQHGAMSVTKSMTGLLGEILVAEGALDEEALVGDILPELADSAFGNATVQQLLEMTTGLAYSEDYSDPNAEIWAYNAAASPLPKPEGYSGPRTYYEYLATVQPEGEHGQVFGYKTINTDALGWVIARTTGDSVTSLLSSRIWQHIGAEQDGYFTVDSIGTPFAAAGYRYLPGGSYRGMWWSLHNDHGAFAARGVHGQTIYIDPTAEMVIVRFASHPVAGNAANDPTSLPAYQAVAEYLLEKAP